MANLWKTVKSAFSFGSKEHFLYRDVGKGTFNLIRKNAKKQDVTINYPKKTEKLAKTYYFNRTKMLDEQGLTAEIIKKRTERWNNQFGTVGVKDVRNLAEYDKQFQEYKGFKGLWVDHHRVYEIPDKT